MPDSFVTSDPTESQSQVPLPQSNGLDVFEVRPFSDASKTLGKVTTRFENIQNTWEHPDLDSYPFASRAEWSLVEWLGTQGISNGAIDSLLKTKYVCFTLPDYISLLLT